jgi:hypothetical protein
LFAAGNTSYNPDKKLLVQSDIHIGAMGAKGPEEPMHVFIATIGLDHPDPSPTAGTNRSVITVQPL